MFSASAERLSNEQYTQAAEALHVLSGMLLFEFARQQNSTRNHICGNFIARADMAVRGIFQLWAIKDYADCWTLHRSLLDRLFHLHALHEADQFEVFEDWSFKEQYEAAHRVRSDPALKGELAGLVEQVTRERKERYKRLSKTPPQWRRPKAEDVAKAMGLAFLYRYGYDYASRYVHPMADDGQEDFFTITKLEPTPDFGDPFIVLPNTVLVGSMVIQEALNASSLLWRSIVYDAVDGVRNFLRTGSPEDHLPVAKVAMLIEDNIPLAQVGESLNLQP